MRTEPGDVSLEELAEALRDGWGIQVAACEYVAVGGGSHHWRVADANSKAHWVTLDDIGTHAHLRSALETAVSLRDRDGLEFVVAPMPTRAGDVLMTLGTRYAVAAYPYLEATPLAFGRPLDDAHASRLAEMLARLHAQPPRLPAAGLELPWRPVLERALGELGVAWAGGPFSKRAHQAFARRERPIRDLLELFDRLAGQAGEAELVVTHGEPHPANLLVDGRLWLVDWDTVGAAPRERDLWWLGDHPAALDRYAQASGRRPDPVRMRLYRLRWQLDDIASFARLFRSAHDRNPDTERWFRLGLRIVTGPPASRRPEPGRP